MEGEVFQGKAGPFSWINRSLRYLFAPFLLSEWRKAAAEAKPATKLGNLKQTVLKLSFYYILFSPLVAMPFYNTCIFHPFMCGDYELAELEGVKKQEAFFFNSEKQRLHGWFFAKPGATKTVLLSHGNAGNLTHRNDLCKQLLQSGASVFIYDYAGFGKSEGSPTVDGCCRDAVAAFDYLNKTLKIPASSIVLYGESIGTAISCQLAAKRPCGALILQSGFQSLPQIAGEKIPVFFIYPRNIFPCNQLDSLAYLKGKHPPLLLIHGEADNIIPPHNSEDLYKAASGEKYLVKLPKAGHNDVPFNLTFECMSALSQFLQAKGS